MTGFSRFIPPIFDFQDYKTAYVLFASEQH